MICFPGHGRVCPQYEEATGSVWSSNFLSLSGGAGCTLHPLQKGPQVDQQHEEQLQYAYTVRC